MLKTYDRRLQCTVFEVIYFGGILLKSYDFKIKPEWANVISLEYVLSRSGSVKKFSKATKFFAVMF